MMKIFYKIKLSLIVLLIGITAINGLAQTTKTIGPAGDFATITAALTDLQANAAIDALIWELQPDYTSTGETFPIAFTTVKLNGINATNTLTIRPAAGATGLVITSNSTFTINLDGGHHVTFDGRPGGIGATSELLISNTLATGTAVQFINMATDNNLLYCEVTGVGTAAAAAVIEISTSTAVSGNSNNLIDHCDIHDGATKPIVLLSSGGTANKLNMNNTISNCNFYNWNMGNSVANSNALSIGANNSGTVITANSFYQTTPTTGITQSTNGFVGLSGSATANNITFSGNYLGGSAPQCGGTPMSLTYQTYYGLIKAINISVGITAATNVQGNTIQNIELNMPAGQGGSFIAMDISVGWVNVGTVTGNVIGSTTGINGIVANYESASTGGSFTGIAVTQQGAATDITNISNNVICGISRPTTTGTYSISGIALGSFYKTSISVTNNTIGSATLANAISNAGPGNITGISAAGRYINIVTGNTIANLTQSNTGTTSNQLIGISGSGSPAGPLDISGNTVHNLKSSSASIGTGSSSSVIGISMSANTAGQKVTNNHIYDLSNIDPTAATSVIGLYYAGATTGTNVVSRNFIQGLTLASSATAASINGIYANAGLTNFQNNMVQMGIDASGTEINTGYEVNGIFDAAGTSNYYNNSVYIGGSGVAGTTSNTFAFKSAVLTNTRAFQNNIFVNARSGGATGKHYAISVAGTSANPAGLTSSQNILFAPGGNIGLFNGTDQLTLTDWQNATGQDILSAAVDPMFVNPTGNSSTIDLHVQASNPVEGSGLLIASVTDDYDGQDRTTLTPTDIGADAGNFTNSGDLFPPNISFVPLVNTASTANLPLSVTITDGVGVSSGANQPRLYFKKATDANVFAGNTSADNGWKYVVPANTSSPYDFTIDYSIINGGSIAPGDVVQYFVVAQDDVNNFASVAAGATASSAINPVQNINGAPASSNLNAVIIINNNFAGTVSVPGNYPNLTGATGLFNAMNIGTVTGNINVLITDNLIEPGTVALNEFASPFTLTLTPGSASLKTISGNIDNGLIRFNGTDRVTIDGRFGGTGKYLEFSNTNTGTSSTNSAFLFVNGATNNTIQYASAKAQAPAGAVISFYAISAYTGNNSYNTIDHCDISNSGSGNLQMGVYSYYNTSGGQHVFNTISNCNIYDFFHAGTSSAYGVYLATGNSDWSITGNSFYQTAARTMPYAAYGILVAGTNGSNFNISNNYIGGSAPNAGGTPWTVSSGAGTFYGMYFLSNTTTPALNATVTNNTITNLDITSTNYYGFRGIYISSSASSGLFTFNGNTIGSSGATDAIVLRGTSTINSGFEKIGNGQSVTYTSNTIGGITAATNFSGISISGTTPGVHTINGNTIGSATVANSIKVGSAATVANAVGISGSSSVANSISNNTIANITNLYEGVTTTGTVKGISFAGTGAATVNGNTIFNLISKSAQPGTLASASVIGIHKIATTAACSVSQNVIYGLENQSPTGVVNIAGISITSASGSVTAARNTIYGLSLSTSATTASMSGIYAGGGVSNFQNNDIRLGTSASGADITTGYAINGIHNGGGTNYYYFNTLNISGSNVAGTTSSTYGLNGTTAASILQDNVFVNTRSGGTTGLHYAVKLASAPTTIDYNDYFVAGGTGFLAAMGATDYTDFATWKSTAVPGKDVASLNVDPAFTSAVNLVPANGALVAGLTIAGITVDNAGTTRAATPTIGAFEAASCTNPTFGGAITASQVGCNPFDPALIESDIINGLPTGYSGTLEYKWQQSVVSAVDGFSDIAATNSETYDPAALTQTTWFRRLARVDCKADWLGAVVSNTVEMTVNPDLPVSVTIAPDANPVCAGTTVTYTATPVNPGANPVYQWKLNGNNVGTNSPTYAVVPANGNTITCVLTSDATPCATGNPATSNTVTMTVNPVTQASILIIEGINSGDVCEGTSKTFFAAPTNGGATPSYQWKVNGTNAGTDANNFTYTPVDGDVVTCELTSSLVCPGVSPAVSNGLTMVVNPTTASVTIAPDQNDICDGTSVTFTATPTNGGTAPAYQWYKNTLPVATGTTYTYVPADGDQVYVVLTSNATCAPGYIATSTTVTMNVIALPTGSISASLAEVCAGSSVDLTFNFTGTGPWDYTYTDGTASFNGTAAASPHVVNVIPAATTTYSLTSVTDVGTGCIEPAPVSTTTVTVHPLLPVSVIIAEDLNNVCPGTTVTLTPAPTNGGTTPTYEWFKNSVLVATTETYSYTAIDGDQVYVVMTSNEPCTSGNPATSNTITMSVNPNLEASVSIAASSNPVCNGTAVTFTSLPINGGTAPTYEWFVNAISVATTDSYTYTPIDGDQIHVVMTSNATPCLTGSPATSSTVTMVVNPILTATVSITASATTVATGKTITLTPAPINGGSAPTYEWFVNGVSVGTGSTYTYTPVNEDDVYAVMTSNATPCLANATATSNTLTITVEVPTPGMVAYWKLDEAAGSTYTDFVGTNNGTGNPSPISVVGKVNGGQQFNGTSTKIDVPANTTFDFAANGNFSVEGWYKGSGIQKMIIGRYITSTLQWYIFIRSDGVVRFTLINGATTVHVNANIVTDGNWHYITATRNGTTGVSKIYVDGVLKASDTHLFTNDFTSPTAKLNIGNLNGNYFLNGSLDEVAVHNVELTPTEILNHYNNGLAGLGYTSNIAPVITSTAPLTGTVGKLYSYDVNANGVPAPTYSLTTAPAGMTINTSTGLIQWIPITGGNYNVTVQASNGVSPPSSQSFNISVTMLSGMIAYWKLDEPVGNTYTDFIGINNGTGNPSPSAVVGQINGAQKFNGTTTKIDAPANPTFDFAANGDFSVEGWYKGNSKSKMIVGRYINSTTQWYIYILSDGSVRFTMINGATTVHVNANIITDGNWHYITATRNGTTGISKIYVDGVLKASDTHLFSTDFSSPTAKLNIGNLNGAYINDGNLDEIAVHNVELTPAEVLRHYNNGVAGLGYYDDIAPLITTTAPLDGVTGQLYSYDVNAEGYPGITYSLVPASGTYPDGMTINSTTGLIAWTPAASGNYSVTVVAENGVNPPASQTFTITVVPPLQSAHITTGLNDTEETSAELSAYAFRKVEIRINGFVNAGAVATLYDMSGRVFRSKILEEGSANILPTPGIKTAIYILHVNDHGKVKTFKIPVND